MWHTVKVYAAVLPIFLAIDLLWLGALMSGFYKRELGPLSRGSGGGYETVVWAAVIVYICIPLGVVLFVLPRIGEGPLFPSALLWGATYGVILYTVYDMTNYALIDKWPLRMSMVDIGWGGVICGITSVVGGWFDRFFT